MIDTRVYEALLTTEEVHHLWPCNYCTNVYKLTKFFFLRIYFSKIN